CIQSPQKKAFQLLGLAQVAFNELRGRWNILAQAGGKVVVYDNLMPIREQTIYEVGANEPGTAGDQNAHFVISTRRDTIRRTFSRQSWRQAAAPSVRPVYVTARRWALGLLASTITILWMPAGCLSISAAARN